jgi:hypothetical protein
MSTKKIIFLKAIAIQVLVISFSSSSFGQDDIAVEYGVITEISQAEKGSLEIKDEAVIVKDKDETKTDDGKDEVTKVKKKRGGAIVGSAASVSPRAPKVEVFSVKMLKGDVKTILMESKDFKKGNCVSIESGSSDNMRLVEDKFCTAYVPANLANEQERKAEECDAVKKSIRDDMSDEEKEMISEKVKKLCK